MDRLLKDALTTCRNVLWRLLVEHEKGHIDLAENKQHVDFAERLAGEALEQPPADAEEEGGAS